MFVAGEVAISKLPETKPKLEPKMFQNAKCKVATKPQAKAAP